MNAFRLGFLVVFAVVAASCTAASLPTTTTSTTEVVATTLGGRVTLIPNATPFVVEGTRGPYVEALQFYLVCTGHEEPAPGATVSVDGSYGPITAAAVAYYQAELRRVPSGSPDEDTFASLARDCNQSRTLAFPAGVFALEFAGNSDVGDPEVFEFAGTGDQVLTLSGIEGAFTITVLAADGSEVETTVAGAVTEVELDEPQAYAIRVESAGPTSFRIAASLRSPNVLVSDFGPMTLEDDGIGMATFGQDPVNTVAVLALLFGPPYEDTGWQEGIAECTGINRHVSWIIQGSSGGTQHPAIFTADLTDTGGAPYFSQYSYRSLDLAALDPLARGLTTPDGLTIGSTLDDFEAVYGNFSFENPELGLVRKGGLLFAFNIAGSADAPDGASSRIRYVGAGTDGCPDAP